MTLKVGDFVLPRVREFWWAYGWGEIGHLKKGKVYQVNAISWGSAEVIDLETREVFGWFNLDCFRPVPKSHKKVKLEELL